MGCEYCLTPTPCERYLGTYLAQLHRDCALRIAKRQAKADKEDDADDEDSSVMKKTSQRSNKRRWLMPASHTTKSNCKVVRRRGEVHLKRDEEQRAKWKFSKTPSRSDCERSGQRMSATSAETSDTLVGEPEPGEATSHFVRELSESGNGSHERSNDGRSTALS